MKRVFMEHEQIGQILTSVEPKDGQVLMAFSVTVARVRGDIPVAWMGLLRNFIEESTVKGILCSERGARKKNLHGQGCLFLYGYLGNDNNKEVARLIKEVLFVQPGDGTQIQVRHITEKDGAKYITGYCQKDEGTEHYRRIIHNMTEEELKKAKEFHDARSKTPLTNAYRVDQKNFHTEAWKFYKMHLSPLPPPNINQMMVYMVNSGQYLPTTSFCKNGMGGHFDWESAQQLWVLMHFPQTGTATDVAHILFRQSDPGDPVYSNVPWADAKLQAQSPDA